MVIVSNGEPLPVGTVTLNCIRLLSTMWEKWLLIHPRLDVHNRCEKKTFHYDCWWFCKLKFSKIFFDLLQPNSNNNVPIYKSKDVRFVYLLTYWFSEFTSNFIVMSLKTKIESFILSLILTYKVLISILKTKADRNYQYDKNIKRNVGKNIFKSNDKRKFCIDKVNIKYH